MRRLKYLSNEANLSFEELELLAEEIRILITGGRPYTVREMINRAENLKSEEMGYRICKVLIFEPKLESYFPNEVFEALQNRTRDERHPEFNKEDDEFMARNIHKGVEWLKNRFYANDELIYDRIDVLDLKSQMPEEDILILEKHKYERKQEQEKDRVDGGII